jgi:hypothetical protein
MSSTTLTVPRPSATTTRLWLPGIGYAAAGAAAATVTAAVAHAAGVSLEIQGEQVPLLGFTNLAFVFSVVGVVIAAGMRRWSDRPADLFVRTAVALTALSLVPDVVVPDASVATRLTLMATHVVTAAIVVPGVRARLR